MDENLLDEKKLLELQKLYRKVAFGSVLVCTVAAVVCMVSLPMVYNYVQYVQSLLGDEMEFCMVKMFCIIRVKILFEPVEKRRLERRICGKDMLR